MRMARPPEGTPQARRPTRRAARLPQPRVEQAGRVGGALAARARVPREGARGVVRPPRAEPARPAVPRARAVCCRRAASPGAALPRAGPRLGAAVPGEAEVAPAPEARGLPVGAAEPGPEASAPGVRAALPAQVTRQAAPPEQGSQKSDSSVAWTWATLRGSRSPGRARA
jgi:hypothetical protein